MKLSIGKLQSLLAYPRVFESLSAMMTYRRLVKGGLFPGIAEVPLTIKSLGSKTVLCRPKTSDATVLWDTFYEGYHLPPEEMEHPKVILDLGANVGFTAAHFAFLYPEAKVIAVEMDSGNAAMAIKNIAPWASRCLLINAAVWTSDGEVIYGGEEEWGFHVLAGESAREGVRRSARALTIDTLLAENGLNKVDYMKMDIEGAEGDVLLHSGSWIDKVASMKVEIHSQDASYDFCESILSKAGFRCFPDKRHKHCIVAIRT
jgi:FkbM family methyltransferase